MVAADTSISTVELQGGESIGLGAVEVTTIPHVAILQKRRTAATGIDAEYKQDIARLLSEIFENYRSAALTHGSREIALELLWCAESAENQPFKANIRLYLIVRAIDDSARAVRGTVSSLLDTCRATLDFQKYEYRSVSFAELAPHIRGIDDTSICAIVKEERIENLHNPILPSCFSFDRLPETENDLSRIASVLTMQPGSAVSFQLIPVAYTTDEVRIVEQLTQALGTLQRGILEQGVGNIGFALAEKHAEVYKYYSRNKSSALFAFNILVFGSAEAVSAISTRVFAHLNITNELRRLALTAAEVGKDENFYPLPWAVHEKLLGTERNLALWQGGQTMPANYRLPYIITAEEASEFFRLPIGGDSVSSGFTVNESARTGRSYSGRIIGGSDIPVGALKSSSGSDTIGIFLDDLTKHMLVVGTPGSGKTTFSVGLLDRLWREHRVPFLVIEPAKNEYRALVKSIPELQVFTPGKSFISPFVFNPFVPPPNVRLEAYKTTLKTAFAAAVSMSTPLDRIFEESVHNCYSDFGWLDSYTGRDSGRAFSISDFIACFRDTFDEIGYTGDARNIGRAGVVRLNGLVSLFDNYFSIPIPDLLSRPTLIELAAIENRDQKALIIALVLLSILAYVNSNYVAEGGLRHVVLLEEAHVLLDAGTMAAMPGEANPSAIAQGLLKRMLAEIRSYGVGIVIADQSPRKVTPDVVALTDIKLAFRLVEADDRDIIARSTNMSDAGAQRLAKLKPGEAFLYFGRLDEPEEVRTEDYRAAKGIRTTLADDELASLSTYWHGKEDKLRPYPECGATPYCTRTCTQARRMLAREVARRIFVRHFKSDSDDMAAVREVLAQISKLIRRRLNGEPFDRELLSCVKVHLFRRIRYGTKIDISEAVVLASLAKR